MSSSPLGAGAKRSLALIGTEAMTGNIMKKGAKSIIQKQSALNREPGEYFEQNGLLYVRPYYFEHFSFAKKRWIGMTVEELYTNEFLEHPKEYYQHAIEKEMIKINNKPVLPTTRIKESDFLQHIYHKHEPPVLAKQIKIIHEDDDLLVVDKPGSYHAHPTGRYFHNTLISRLKHLYGYEFLASVNRLDRLTSGVMILAKNSESARRLTNQMTERQVEKEYLAKVDGKLGEFDGDVIRVDMPVGIVNRKLCIHAAFPSLEGENSVEAKESQTIFTRKSYCPVTNTTIVNCKPLTGRTHQIRVHLRHLGHPISNDKLYNNPLWNSGNSHEHLSSTQMAFRVAEKMMQAVESGEFDDDESLREELEDVVNLRNAKLVDFNWRDNLCYQCANAEVKEPSKESLFIYLHAFKYSFRASGQVFETELPDWAIE